MLTEKEVFQKAFALVSNPETWCQGVNARDLVGQEADVFSPDAVQFCSLGAIFRACETTHQFYGAYGAVKNAFCGGDCIDLTKFNDRHNHAEVVELWKKVGQENGWL